MRKSTEINEEDLIWDEIFGLNINKSNPGNIVFKLIGKKGKKEPLIAESQNYSLTKTINSPGKWFSTQLNLTYVNEEEYNFFKKIFLLFIKILIKKRRRNRVKNKFSVYFRRSFQKE